ncbi:MAG: DUF4160 domain-containing protein [Bacteroidota bacterium]
MHVHARKGEFESKAEIILSEGKIEKIIIRNIKGRKPLKGKDLTSLKKFLEHYSDEIVRKWIDYFVYQKDIHFERITRRL